MFPYLTFAIFLPFAVALLVLCLPSNWKNAIKWVSLAGSVVTFLIVSIATWNYRGVEETLAGKWGHEKVEAAKDVARGHVVRGDKDPAYLLFDKVLDRPKSLDAQETAALREAGLFYLYEKNREYALAVSTPTAAHLKYVEHHAWIPTFKIHYFLAADGLSLPLLWLTTLLGVLCLIYSWTIEKATKAYFALFLMLQGSLAGVFVALDFFLFYVFWELVLLPMYFLIGFWGGPRRIYAAIKFFIYTLVGSVLMLIAMIALYLTVEPHSFNLLSMIAVVSPEGAVSLAFKQWVFIALFIGFAIKVPVFPFHTWLPDAHVEAPTAASVILAGVLLKMGGYGFFRFSYTLLPEVARSQSFLLLIALLGLINIVYGALCAMAQRDFKSLVAYSSISHMGYVLLGMAAITLAGMSGAVLQMFTHGLSSAMMFLLVGVLYDRAHHRNLDDFGGIGLQMPYYTGLATVGFFAALGLPGLCGFVSEALVFLGAWDGQSLIRSYGYSWIVLTSLAGVVLGAAYILWTIQRVFMGGCPEKYKRFPDLDLREWFALTPLALMCIVIGVYPRLILDYMDPTIRAILKVAR